MSKPPQGGRVDGIKRLTVKISSKVDAVPHRIEGRGMFQWRHCFREGVLKSEGGSRDGGGR